MATNDDARGEIVDNGFRFVLFVFEICWTYEIYSQTEVKGCIRSPKGATTSMESLILLKLEKFC